ncbi:MAG: cytochrome c [Myxococcota bacterium]|jgi:mono/diheme cytochrome c family protein|nr:cytochrome c [Myxococcota bacterium]
MFHALLIVMLAVGCESQVADDEGDCGVAGCSDSGTEATGEELYASICAACHGTDGTGSGGSGPDIVHELNRSDEEIIEVILNGTGSMPPADVTEAQAQLIVDYMRASWE